MSQEKLLTVALAEEMIRSQDFKSIGDFTSIEDQAAAALAACQYWRLSLNGLTSLSDAAAVALASYKELLELNGLTSLSDAAAVALANYKGPLELGGLARLGDAAALALAEHHGSLRLSGLVDFSEAVAVALSKHKGELDLSDAGWAQFKFGQQLVRRADYQAKRPPKTKSKDLFNKGLMTIAIRGGKLTVDLWPGGRLFLSPTEDWLLGEMQSPDMALEFNPRNLESIISRIKSLAMRHGESGWEFSDVYPESLADIRWLHKRVSAARCVGTAAESPSGANVDAAVRMEVSEGKMSSSKKKRKKTKKKKPSEPVSAPLWLPLSTLLAMLQSNSIKARLDGSVLIADHGNCTTWVKVLPPDPRATGSDRISAVVRVLTILPGHLSSQYNLGTAAGAAILNQFASLGAVTASKRRLMIGSRLTILKGECGEYDHYYLPLLLSATISATEGVLGGIDQVLTDQSPRTSGSDWTDLDLSEVQRDMKICGKFSDCIQGDGALNAKIRLDDGFSSASGHCATALFDMIPGGGHPQIGGGLFCLLYLPHIITDSDRLEQICELLNTCEFDALDADQPPHFGAWHPAGEHMHMHNCPVYQSFLPNAMHLVPGIAGAWAWWAEVRAKWAASVLATAGVNL